MSRHAAEVDPISLSFVDVISCGLGAALFLFLLFVSMPQVGEIGLTVQAQPDDGIPVATIVTVSGFEGELRMNGERVIPPMSDENQILVYRLDPSDAINGLQFVLSLPRVAATTECTYFLKIDLTECKSNEGILALEYRAVQTVTIASSAGIVSFSVEQLWTHTAREKEVVFSVVTAVSGGLTLSPSDGWEVSFQ